MEGDVVKEPSKQYYNDPKIDCFLLQKTVTCKRKLFARTAGFVLRKSWEPSATILCICAYLGREGVMENWTV